MGGPEERFESRFSYEQAASSGKIRGGCHGGSCPSCRPGIAYKSPSLAGTD